MSEQVQARRDRAFRIAEDMIMSGERPSAAVSEAVEVATQVTADEMSRALDAFQGADVQHIKYPDCTTHRLAVALAELGFEVARREQGHV